MNLPSSLALSPSKLFQSRTGLLVLALIVVLLGAGVFLFVARPPMPTRSPTVATSPAAVATPRPAAKPLVFLGPPAPAWVVRVPVPGAAPGPAAPVGAPVVAGAKAPPLPAAAAPIPGVPAAGAETPPSLDARVLFAREQYHYTSANRRDPFLSLLEGRFLSQSGDGSLVDVGDMHLVGIMWGSSDKFALVEDSRGRGFVLRVGDPVVNGYISGITRSEIQVVQNGFGDTQTLSIQLKPKVGDKNAARN